MAYRAFNLEEVARYLHLASADIERLVKDREIPFEKRGNRVVFPQQDIDAWASQRILGMKDRGLTEYHQKSMHGTREILPNQAFMPDLLEPRFIQPAMAAKTRAAIVREMVTLAEKTGRVYDPQVLRLSLEEREALCSTGLPGGLAVLHARHHEPYMFESSFVALGRSLQEIHFGAPDGQPTDLFFLVCCEDDRIHLHTLARLCLMAQKTPMLALLRQAPDAATMYEHLIASEVEVLLGRKTS